MACVTTGRATFTSNLQPGVSVCCMSYRRWLPFSAYTERRPPYWKLFVARTGPPGGIMSFDHSIANLGNSRAKYLPSKFLATTTILQQRYRSEHRSYFRIRRSLISGTGLRVVVDVFKRGANGEEWVGAGRGTSVRLSATPTCDWPCHG